MFMDWAAAETVEGHWSHYLAYVSKCNILVFRCRNWAPEEQNHSLMLYTEDKPGEMMRIFEF